MTQIKRSAIVPFTQAQMYALVNDVASYPQFVPGCTGAEVLESTDTSMTARLDLQAAGFRQSITTRNTMEPPRSISLNLVDGPVKSLTGEWQFHALEDGSCRVELELEIGMRRGLLALAAGKVVQTLATEQVDVMVRRARALYGKTQ